MAAVDEWARPTNEEENGEEVRLWIRLVSTLLLRHVARTDCYGRSEFISCRHESSTFLPILAIKRTRVAQWTAINKQTVGKPRKRWRTRWRGWCWWSNGQAKAETKDIWGVGEEYGLRREGLWEEVCGVAVATSPCNTWLRWHNLPLIVDLLYWT